MRPKIKNLICAVCGRNSPAYLQWWNQDTGYGICPRDFEESVDRDGLELSIACYGRPNVHHSIYPDNKTWAKNKKEK